MKKIAAIALVGAATMGVATVQADTFVGVVGNYASAKVKAPSQLKSEQKQFDKIIDNDWTYGIRAGQSTDGFRYYATYEYVNNKHNGLKLRQDILSVSVDKTFDLNSEGTQLFAGGTVGANRLDNKSSGYKSDNTYGYVVGVQAGVIQKLSDNFSVEGGYRYLYSNTKVDFETEAGVKQGSAKLKNTKGLYLAASYHF